MKPVRILMCVVLTMFVAGCAKENPSEAPAATATEMTSTATPAPTSTAAAATETAATESATTETSTTVAEVPAASRIETKPVAGSAAGQPKAATNTASQAPVPTPAPPKQAPAEPTPPAAEAAMPAQATPVEAPAPSGGGEALVAEGRSIFDAKCASCHGANGGNDTAIGRSRKVPPFGSAAVQNLSDAELTKIIHEGKGDISAKAHKSKALTDAEVRAVIAFIRSLH